MKIPTTKTCIGLALLLALPVASAATVAANAAPAAMQEPVCTADLDPAFALRKSIAVLNIEVAQPLEASDMPQLGTAVARYLQQALAADESIRVRDGSNYSMNGSHITLMGQYDTSAQSRLAQLSKQLESQLIISGRITDLSHQARNETPMDQLMGRLPGLSGWRTKQRHFALELSVYDGYSGTELATKRLHTKADGRVDMGGLQPLSSDFLASDYGHAVGELLSEAAEQLQRSVSCIPMMTRITDIEGESLLVEEGNDSLLRPGDRLRVFHRRYIGVDSMGRERFQEEYISDAQVTHIFPRSARLKLDDGSRLVDLRPGDLARAGE